MSGRACGKRRFATRARAWAAIEAIKRDSPKGAHVPRRPYACPRCHGWHLTSQA